MNRFTDSIRKAVADENWYSAVGLALAMPDICGKIDDPGISGSQNRFEAWFEAHLAGLYKSEIGGVEVVFMSAADCYALRCCYLHAGEDDISDARAQETLEKFYFTTRGVHRIKVEKTLTLNVIKFCEEFCDAVESWWAIKKDDPDAQKALERILVIHTEPFSPQPGVRIG